MKEKISVITVVYNDAINIERTIQSVINQNYDSIEYIVIDGKSTDGTLSILQNYKDKIDILVSEPDKGIYDAMNKGIKKATGEWIIFMNSGDVFYNQDVLSNIFNNKIQPEINFIYSDFEVENSNGTIKYFEASFKKGILLHQAAIYKRELHNKLGYYHVTSKYIVSDYIFFMTINENETYKTKYIIARNQAAGVSAANWCGYQKICCDYIFSRISIYSLIFKLIDRIIKNFIKKTFHIK